MDATERRLLILLTERASTVTGSALLDAGIERLEGAGCAVIELSVTETNTDAQRLYLSRGFEFTGTDEALRNLYTRRVTDGG